MPFCFALSTLSGLYCIWSKVLLILVYHTLYNLLSTSFLVSVAKGLEEFYISLSAFSKSVLLQLPALIR